MALPDYVRVTQGTAIVWGEAGASGVTATCSLDALANGAARQTASVDLGPSFFASDGFSRVGARNTSWYWDDDHINTRAVQAVLADVLLHLVLALQNGCESSSATSSTLPALPVKSKQE